MKKNKEHKGHESTIGKIIYGFMLFAPLIAILSAILVNTFNEKETETQINYKYETNDVNTIDDLVVGNIYTFTIEDLSNTPNYGQFLDCFYINLKDFYNVEYIISEPNTYLYRVSLNDNLVIGVYQSTGSGWQYNLINTSRVYLNNNFSFDFVYRSLNNTTLLSNISKCENIPIESIEEEEYKTKDIFYTAVNDVEQSNLFNWSKNSIIYTGIHETCETLSIDNTFIPMLLAYWLIMSILYFLYDIILMILQILHKKIHELQDSF